MKSPVAGIIAEYNPLHRGHAYHIAQTRKNLRPKGVVVVLSSDFLQRGEPACVHKWTRTAMALHAGADLVLELPVLYSCHNAGVFAGAGVDLLAATGVVTHLSFGMENPEMDLLGLADIVVQEPLAFKEKLRLHLEKGESFAEAQRKALAHCAGEERASELGTPNNILALAYARRILKKKHPIALAPMKRRGGGYHDPRPEDFASATAVRRLLFQGKHEEALELLPPFSAKLLAEDLKKGRGLTDWDHLWRIFQAVMLRSSPEELGGMAEIREGFEHRLLRQIKKSGSWPQMVEECASRRYPRTRVQRAMAHILLGLDEKTNRRAQELGPPYLRVLGFSSAGQGLLREMRNSATLPLISKGAFRDTSNFGYTVISWEHRSTALWEQLCPSPRKDREKTQRVIRIP